MEEVGSLEDHHEEDHHMMEKRGVGEEATWVVEEVEIHGDPGLQVGVGRSWEKVCRL